MNVLIACDSFKGTLSAQEVCKIIASAFKEYDIFNVQEMPVADGGEGLCDCFKTIFEYEKVPVSVTGPYGEKINSEYIILKDKTAVIEMAACAGLPIVKNNKNPEKTTTYGVGEMIKDAVNKDCISILLGLGGSATNDCGTGMAKALGFRFLDENGNDLPGTGESLERIRRIVLSDKTVIIPVTAACDVENPLFGKNGAAYVYAPQKGADSEMVKRLDEGMVNFSSVALSTFGKDVSSLSGAGAAGGMGAGAVLFLNAELKKGIDIVLDKLGFDNAVSKADIVITGEGRLDFQSYSGKVISGIIKRCDFQKQKLITVCGCEGIGARDGYQKGISAMYFSSGSEKSFEEIQKNCKNDLYAAAKKVAEDLYLMYKEK
ncbi:MAG: glycerate kinase [Clostridiales bacterium]|nr:glycerate kinase [Clostridiales bacterium]